MPQHTQNEEWRPIPGWEGLYEVSDQGRIKSLARTVVYKDGRKRPQPERVLKFTSSDNVYPYVQLSRNNKYTKMYLHDAMLSAFVGPRPDGYQACHNDGDRLNNTLENLRWDTVSGNQLDRVEHGRHHNAEKGHCPLGHVLQVPNLHQPTLAAGRRRCLACEKAYKATYHNPKLKPRQAEMAHSNYRSIMKEAS